MAKKIRKSTEIHETNIESVETNPSDESTSLNASPQEETGNQPPAEEMSASTESESPSEDLLDDVRRSLIEEDETDKQKKEIQWWRRLGRKQKNAEPEPSPPIVEIDLPDAPWQTEMAEEQKQATISDEYVEPIDDLIDKLKAEHQESKVEPPSVVEVETPPAPGPEIDLEQLKEQAFRPRTHVEGESESDVRSIALEGGEEVFVEVEAKAADPFEDRLKGLENALRPYRRQLYMMLALVGVVMAVIASLLIFNVYQQSRPQPTQEAANLPYPVAVSLPGGWSFNLGRGTLQAGQWEPTGPEWLEGTEVCRWVSLPWSLQLEAVIRILKPDEPIEVVMSNNDKLVYGVYSVTEMTPDEIQKLDAHSPCLLLILTGSESEPEKRWVLRALP